MKDFLGKFLRKNNNVDKNIFSEKKELIPKHIAIIMDGNGRWANKRGLPRIAGHKAGMNVVKEITRESSNLGIQYLTLYAFSTENWKRPTDEVNFLMKLPEEYLQSELKDLVKNNVQVRMIGDIQQLPDFTRRAVEQAIEDTKGNTGLVLNFALNYGSRLEMLTAIKEIANDISNHKIKIDDITEASISSRLMTAGIPDPDLLIRTSGEIRLSNFLLWQLAYTEFYFSDTLWPDFSMDEYHMAIANYMKRARRYGGLK
ncbi:isoprenyl transferase [Desulfuribacillus stibiiarsenatis]|uniref:Isoprenyl transferase n=1 Tax=Desulfuribacillus stibiiarsenatis TaxID=1390249 RepID=A0A1E5L720_9FIRM|nr:isoprenyl transferase [Desulfuribacillus stibiiarsenatis]OEH85848.1 isoprenyl transferase [Desulfuribacillus stibiiarsenatis]